MIVNLSKNFKFNRDEKFYEIDYLFSNKTGVNPVPGIFLNLNISVDGSDKKSFQVSKPTSILYLSNEEIEKIIAEDSIAL
jgi:hypothetical protein